MKSRVPRLRSCVVGLTLACSSESSRLDVAEVATPVSDSVLTPWLADDGDRQPLLSWLAPLGGTRYALRFAVFDGGRWSAPVTVVEDDSIFIHATEIPSVRGIGGGTLAAVWQRRGRGAEGRGVYGIRVAMSGDGGTTWGRPVTPHRSPAPGGTFEFPLAYRTASGELGVFWIDPRRLTGGEEPRGSRALMWTTVARDGRLGPEMEVDSVACDCCPMDAAVTGDGALFVYRDKELPPGMPLDSLRFETSVVRDIAVARLDADADSAAPAWRHRGMVHRDGWVYNGCPNNGPAVSAGGNRVAVAWWTAEGGRPRVQVAFSADGGRNFAAPVVVSTGRPEGQAAVGLVPQGAVVLWLEDGRVRARLVRAGGPDGSGPSIGPPLTLGRAGGRHRLPPPALTSDGRLLVTWLGPGSRLTARLIHTVGTGVDGTGGPAWAARP